MRFIKLAILSFIFLFLLVTVISLFVPSNVRISRATDINATKQVVMSFLADPLRWKEWYPGGDSLDILYIEGNPRGLIIDSVFHGIEVTSVTDSVVTATDVGLGVRQTMETGWKVLSGDNENNVTVQWYMDFKLRWYPWEKFKSLFFENIYGAHLEQGLANLKAVSEGRRSSFN